MYILANESAAVVPHHCTTDPNSNERQEVCHETQGIAGTDASKAPEAYPLGKVGLLLLGHGQEALLHIRQLLHQRGPVILRLGSLAGRDLWGAGRPGCALLEHLRAPWPALSIFPEQSVKRGTV